VGVVKDMTYDEISKYDAGTWFHEKYRGQKIPTLKEYLRTINGKCILLIEIKGGDEEYPGLEIEVANLVQEFEATKWVVVQSFNINTVLRIKKIDKKIKTFYLLGRNFEDYYNELLRNIEEKSYKREFDGLAPHHSYLDSEKANMIHSMGYEIFTWTVNESVDMKKVIEMKVDGIITDSPDILSDLLDR